MNIERILEIIENNDKYYILGFIQGIIANKEILKQENAELKKQLNELQKPQIFIDTQDMEEKWGEELYQDYLEEQVKKLKQDHLITCCGIPIADIPKLIEKNRQLENNWNELKRWLYEDNYLYIDMVRDNSTYTKIFKKMQELERGVSDVED